MWTPHIFHGILKTGKFFIKNTWLSISHQKTVEIDWFVIEIDTFKLDKINPEENILNYIL